MDVQFHLQRLGAARLDRSNWDSQWEESAARVIPAHRNTFQSIGGTQPSGAKNTELQFDATVSFACQRFSSVIESLVTPQSAVWHLLKVLDKTLKRNRQVRMFFDDLSETLHNYRYRPIANFVGNSQAVYLGLGAYGNGTLFIDQPDNGKGLRYRNIHLGETYWIQNHANIVDTVYRVWKWSARQMVGKWGKACPAEVQERANNANSADALDYEILHCVYPRDQYDPQRVDGKGRPFASVYIDVKTRAVLEEDGYFSFPYAITRYTQFSGETYGRGPAQWVLPAIKSLNEQKKTNLKQGHRAADPVLLAYDDGKLANASLKPGKMVAGGMSKDGRMLVGTLPVGNFAIAQEMMDAERELINDAFLITLFQILIDSPQMTATEVLERAREKGMLLAPTAGRIQAEFLGPMIEREIDLLARQGLLPKMPQILVDASVEYKIEYDNPMSRMARAEKAAGFMRALGQAAEYSKMTGDMEPLDWFNFDKAIPAVQDIMGAPVDWTRSEEEVAERRAGRAQQAEQQQMVEAAPALAAVAKSAPQGPAA